MNPSAAWAMLTARSPAFPRMPGGHNSLTKEDVAAMLSDLYRDACLMGMAYECHDMKALQDLELRLWQIVIGMSQREPQWKLPKGEFVTRRLAALALYEAMDPLVCPVCNGKGTTTFQLHREPGLMLSQYFSQLNEWEGRIRCMGCQGSGKVKLSARKRADLAGINKDTWPKYWASRYEEVFALTKGWLSDARAHLARKLRKNAEDEAA